MVRSILSNWMAMLTIGVISFVLTPILIQSLGPFYYGMWILAASVLDYYGLLHMGLQTTLQRFVATFRGAEQGEVINEILLSALALAVGVSILICGLTILLAGILPDFFRLTGPDRTLFTQLVILLGLSIAVMFPAQVLGAYLCGMQRFDLYNLAAITVAIGRALLLLFLLRLGFGLLGVAAVSLATTVFSLLLHWKLVRWANPQISFQWQRVSARQIRQLIEFGFYVFLSRLGDQLRFNVDAVVIGRFVSMASVTPFGVASRLMEYFRSILYGVLGPLLPAMSELHGQCRQEGLNQMFLRATKGTTLVSLLIGCLLLLNGRALLRLWVGEEFVSSYPLLVILTVGYVVALAQSPSVAIIYAKGRHGPLGWWTVGEGVVNLLLSIHWARKYGLEGVALGTAVPMLAFKILVQPWYALRVAGLSGGSYLIGALARPLLVCGLFLCLALGLVPPSWFDSANTGVLSFMWTTTWQIALFGALSYWFGLNAWEKELLRERSKRMASFLGLVGVG